MLYIHQNSCISPQQTFLNADLNLLVGWVDNMLKVVEPHYEAIPPAVLRRMGKAVRMGVGAALPLVQQTSVDGIILGTADGAVEDCIKFLNQIIQYDEGMLTPGNFVQSTLNAIASQVGLLTKNKGYNITHVHKGLAFENALLDAMMLVEEHPGKNYLLGAADEIAAGNYNIDYLAGWFKTESLLNSDLFTTNITGSIAGEGATMFVVNNIKSMAISAIQDISMLHTESEEVVTARLQHFLDKNLYREEKIDLLISGENGDNRLLKFYTACESLVDTSVARFKHMSGEFATASAMACWLACNILEEQAVPAHMMKTNSLKQAVKKILIYNNYKGVQHSFILLSNP